MNEITDNEIDGAKGETGCEEAEAFRSSLFHPNERVRKLARVLQSAKSAPKGTGRGTKPGPTNHADSRARGY